MGFFKKLKYGKNKNEPESMEIPNTLLRDESEDASDSGYVPEGLADMPDDENGGTSNDTSDSGYAPEEMADMPDDETVSASEEMITDALYSEDDDVRRKAVSEIDNEKILGMVVMKERCEDILMNAFDRINSPDVLQQIIEKAESIDVRLMADEKRNYKDQRFNDITKKKWVHAGSVTSRGAEVSIALAGAKASQRIKAIESISDQKILAIVAEEDDRPEVRKAAVKKLRNLDELDYIIRYEEDEDVINAAVESYYIADEIKYDKFGENPRTKMTAEIASKATDQKLLYDIASNTINFDAREAAFNNIWDKELLYQFYYRKYNYDLRDQYVLFDRAIEYVLQSEEKVNELSLEGNPFALKKLLNQEIIEKLALDKSRDAFQRTMAIKRLCNLNVVKAILNDEKESEEIKSAARKKLVGPGLTANLGKIRRTIDASDGTSDRYAEVKSAIERLADEDILFEYAMQEREFPFDYFNNYGYDYCIESIIGKIYNREYLKTIACKSWITRNCMLAAERANLEDLKDIYISSMAKVEVRRVCARRELNQEQLYFYALDDNDMFVRETAVYRITDNELLKKLAIFSDDERVRRIAISRMTNPKDIAVVANNAPVTRTRRLAVKHELFTDSRALSEIALNDSNYYVCLDALEKVSDEDCLRDIVLNSEDDLIRYTAIRKISDEKKLDFLLRRLFTDRDSRKEILERMENQETLMSFALYDSDPKLQLLAAGKLTDQDLIMFVLEHSESLDVKQKAVSKLTDDLRLKEICESEAPISIRTAAAYKLYGNELYRHESIEEEKTEEAVKERKMDEFINSSTVEPEAEKPAFSYITRGNSSPSGKNNVYLTAANEDFYILKNDIAADILEKQNCAIWYLEPGTEYEESEYFADLSQMQLFVVPVTKRFLETDNRARLVDLKYAVDNHKPVLPIMMERGLEEEFNNVCGSLHTINAVENDITAKNYKLKMEEFLSSVLIGDEFAEKIRKAFDAYIFLSYRKKDRALAHELMKLIHNNEFCRDIAIWYDEFLVPGRNFNEAIYDALEKSQIFALVVTPNLVNEKNYVMTTEYPFAKKLDKHVMPFEMKKLENSEARELRTLYEDIGNCINPKNGADVEAKLKEIIKEYAISTDEKDAEHDFFIGLAYLNGIDVEFDKEKALKLILSAADRDVKPAVLKLVQMYKYGEGVQRNTGYMLKYQRKYVELLESEMNRESQSADRKQYIQALLDLAEYMIELDSEGNLIGEAEEELKKAMYMSEIFAEAGDESWAGMMNVECISRLGDLYALRGDWTEAQKFFAVNMERFKSGDGSGKNHRLLGITYTQLGRNALHENSSFVAQDYFSGAIIEFEHEYEKTGSDESGYGMAEAWAYLGDSYYMDDDYDTAEKCFRKARDISKSLVDELNTEAARTKYENFQSRFDNFFDRVQEDLFE